MALVPAGSNKSITKPIPSSRHQINQNTTVCKYRCSDAEEKAVLKTRFAKFLDLADGKIERLEPVSEKTGIVKGTQWEARPVQVPIPLITLIGFLISLGL